MPSEIKLFGLLDCSPLHYEFIYARLLVFRLRVSIRNSSIFYGNMAGFELSQLFLLLSITSIATGASSRDSSVRVSRYPRGILRPRDTTITTSSRNPNANAYLGIQDQLTTIYAGVTYWLSGLGTHDWFGNVNNYGQVIISQTDYVDRAVAGGQTCDWAGHTTTDGNLYTGPGSSISLNDFGSGSAPTYDWYLRSFTNYGSLQMCGRGDTGGSTYQLYGSSPKMFMTVC